MLLSVCVVLALVLGHRLVSWYIIETLETDMSFLTLVYTIKFGTISSSSDLEAANLPFVVVVKNNKDRLYNDLISLMKELGIKWNDPEAYGELFLRKLCDVSWYLDGHHHTIAEHSPKIFWL